MNNESNRNNEPKTIVKGYEITRNDGIVSGRNLSGPENNRKVENRFFYGDSKGKTIITNDKKYTIPFIVIMCSIFTIITIMLIATMKNSQNYILAALFYVIVLFMDTYYIILIIINKDKATLDDEENSKKTSRLSLIITLIILLLTVIISYLMKLKTFAITILGGMAMCLFCWIFNRLSSRKEREKK